MNIKLDGQIMYMANPSKFPNGSESVYMIRQTSTMAFIGGQKNTPQMIIFSSEKEGVDYLQKIANQCGIQTGCDIQAQFQIFQIKKSKTIKITQGA